MQLCWGWKSDTFAGNHTAVMTSLFELFRKISGREWVVATILGDFIYLSCFYCEVNIKEIVVVVWRFDCFQSLADVKFRENNRAQQNL